MSINDLIMARCPASHRQNGQNGKNVSLKEVLKVLKELDLKLIKPKFEC